MKHTLHLILFIFIAYHTKYICSDNDSMILGLIPNPITDIDARDGIDIVLTVDNVNITDTSSIICNFRTFVYNSTVQSSFVNQTTIICRLSNYTDQPTAIQVHVSLDDGKTWLGERYGYNYIYMWSQCGGNGCSYGYCRFNSCVCYDGSVGSACDQCMEGYFRTSYGSCLRCTNSCLNNGTCTNQTCLCREGFGGDGCYTCAEHHYGLNCTQYPLIFDVNPLLITYFDARDGIDIVLTIDNVNITDTSSIICNFRTFVYNWTVQSSFVNQTTIICRLSNYTDQSTVIQVHVSLDDGKTWLEERFGYNYIYMWSQCGGNICSYGYCRFNSCICNDGYVGSACDQCMEGYFRTSYGSCLSCTNSCFNNGTCTNQTCLCREGFGGDGCYTCAEHHYGSNCTQYPLILEVYPLSITDFEARDGIDIFISVDNVNLTDLASIICNFRTFVYNWTVQSSFVNQTTIICRLSNYTNQSTAIRIQVSLDDGKTWLGERYGYNYIHPRPQCRANACSYGYCRFNSCICNDGYVGSACDQCMEGYFRTSYGSCLSCTNSCLNNGTCTNQTCLCREGFGGDGCYTCAKHHYGSNCSAIPVVLSVSPNSIIDIDARDGIDIVLTVDNVNITDTSSIICNFMIFFYNWTVQSSFINQTTIICRLSNYTNQSTAIRIQVSLDDGKTWLGERYGYNYIHLRPQCRANACSYGYCRFNSCVCYDGYVGLTCDQCEEDYFMSSFGSCLKCSYYCMNNGICINQTCVCSDRFTGFRCASCVEHHHGPDCLKYPIVLSVIPNWITDTASRDGVSITVNGDNFNVTDLSQTLCRFQSTSNYTAQALEASSTTIICYLSNFTEFTRVQLFVSIDNGINWLPFENHYYSQIYIYPDCGNNPCNYGRCSYGKCLCRANWNTLQVLPTRGEIYGGYPLTLYGICFNESSYVVYINNEKIDDCQSDGVTLVCTMPMLDEGRLQIQVFNSADLIGETFFWTFLPEEDASSILANDLEIANRIWTEEDDDKIILNFESNYLTMNYLFQIIVFDYSSPIDSGNGTAANFSRRRLDLGLGLLNLSNIENFTIPRDSFISNDSSDSTFHSLGLRFEMVSNEKRRRALPAILLTVYRIIKVVRRLASVYCLGWRWLQSDANTQKLIDEVPPCPRQVVTTWPQQAVGFSADPACDGRKSGFWNCRFHPGATGCYRAQSTTSDAGAQCCYDSVGTWIESGPGAGTIDAISPEKSALGHFMVDVVPFFACCYKKIISGESCDDYTKHRPPGNPIDITLVPIGGRGDPHFSILNGQSYTFNGHGEYVLLKVSTISLEIQVRLAAMTNDLASTGDTATAITAFVIQLGNQSRVQFDLISQSKTVEIRVDGRLLDASDINSFDESVSSSSSVVFSNDQQLTVRQTNLTKYHISYSQARVDIDVNIRPQFDFLDLPIVIPRSVLESATCQGLLGDLQGLALPNGTRVTIALDDEEHMFEYGESWRTTNSSTSFTYALFDSHAKRQDFNYRPVFRAELFDKYNNTKEYRAAEQTCQNLTKRDDCMYDILIMTDPTVAATQQIFEDNEKTLEEYNEIVEATINSRTSTTLSITTATPSATNTVLTEQTSSAPSNSESTSTTKTTTQIGLSSTTTGTTETISPSSTGASSSSTTTGTAETGSPSSTATDSSSTITASSTTTTTFSQPNSSSSSVVTSSAATSTSDDSKTTTTSTSPMTSSLRTSTRTSGTTTKEVLIQLTPISDYCP